MGQTARKFFADRGTHLAAMIAYFALLSFVPLVYLSLAVLGTAHQPASGSFFVRELQHAFPSTSLKSILHAIRKIRAHATLLGAVGAGFLGWSSLSLFSVLESAFNIVYGRPNRPFLRGKTLAAGMIVVSLGFLYVGLAAGSIGVGVARRYLGLGHNVVLAYGLVIAASLGALFVFLTSAYLVLPNTPLSLKEVLPGAILAAVVLEATFQLLPEFVRLSQHNPVLQTLSGPAVLLVWLYLMANVIVFGAEVNWNRRYGMSPKA